MSSVRRAGFLLAAIGLGLGLAGCSNKLWDPTQVGRFRPTPAVNVILDSLGAAEEAPVAWETGEEPRPSDILPPKTDYVLSPGDLVRISIFELLQEGLALVNDYVISETGKLSVPEVGVIQAAGLTETQLEEEIRQILSPNILREPSVTVMLMNSQQRTFSILGNGVARPSRYVIPRNDFRLTDALATAGAQMQFNVSYVYVSRREEGAVSTRPLEPGTPLDDETEKRIPELELIKPEPIPQPGPPFDSQSFLPTAPDGTSTSGTPRDILEPSQPAEKFETEREMLDLIAPSARGAPNARTRGPQGTGNAAGHSAAPAQGTSWPPSQKVAGTAAGGTKAREGEVAASVMAYGFRSVLPPKPKGPPQVPPTSLVQSPVEFGSPLKASDFRANGARRNDVPAGFAPVQAGPGPNPLLQSDMLGSATAPARPETAAPAGDGKPQERIEWIFRDGKWIPVPVAGVAGSEAAAPEKDPDSGFEWAFRDGRWVPVPKGEATPPAPKDAFGRAAPVPGSTGFPPAKDTSGLGAARAPEAGGVRPAAARTALPMELEWEQAVQTRLIRIPADKLLAGDPRYNIVVQPGDTIHVPVDLIGEFAIMGNVNRSGFINITGRPMTLKMAIAAAGGLGPLAWPKQVEVVRRIGTRKEEIVLVDLDKIAAGEQPDFFIKPNDLINVGTEATTRWRLVLRNAFRAAYGFAFVYDRNFADTDFGEHLNFPSWL